MNRRLRCNMDEEPVVVTSSSLQHSTESSPLEVEVSPGVQFMVTIMHRVGSNQLTKSKSRQ